MFCFVACLLDCFEVCVFVWLGLDLCGLFVCLCVCLRV